MNKHVNVQIKPVNEDKEQQDLERETKMNIGMQKFMMQENDYRTLTDLIDESESKFNDLGGDIGMFRIVRVIYLKSTKYDDKQE